MEWFTEYYKNVDTDVDTDSNKKSKTQNQNVKKIEYQFDIAKPTTSKTQNICRVLCFVAGAMLEAYTYKLNPGHSTGLGWGFFAAAVLF